ncbi:hypothetical protein J4429_03590 [Candidatus Pacearchaeota archaeon]|nr:hypothetical protein [Candidatus Pacearchaeota archaeon]
MIKAKILIHTEGDKYNFEIVNSLGTYTGNVSLKEPYKDSLDDAARQIASRLNLLKADCGQYEEKNGSRFQAFWSFSLSGTSVKAKPIDKKIAYDLHWRILNKMLGVTNQTLETRAA